MKTFITTTALLLGFTATVSSLAQAKTAPTQVTASGYHGLAYGQKVDQKSLTKAGLALPNNANATCYYVPLSKKQTRNSSLLQVIDNRLGLIQIKDRNVAVFSSIKVGDSVTKVLRNNNGLPTYEVDKYDDGTGNNYHLIYTLPNKNQIKYTMTGGSKMPNTLIAPKNWNPATKRALTGTVQSISVGTPNAIALVEGCS